MSAHPSPFDLTTGAEEGMGITLQVGAMRAVTTFPSRTQHRTRRRACALADLVVTGRAVFGIDSDVAHGRWSVGSFDITPTRTLPPPAFDRSSHQLPTLVNPCTRTIRWSHSHPRSVQRMLLLWVVRPVGLRPAPSREPPWLAGLRLVFMLARVKQRLGSLQVIPTHSTKRQPVEGQNHGHGEPSQGRGQSPRWSMFH